jgi:hypothetical protein
MVQKMRVAKLKPNPNNPRLIKDEKFQKLVESIRNFPEMLEARPIVVNEELVVLGGNMRLKALIEAGVKEAPVEIVNWDEAKQKEFTIKDNVGFGDWDFNALANEWDSAELDEWGLDVWQPSEELNLDDFFEEKAEDEGENKTKIVLEYTEADYAEVLELFKKHSGSKEQIVMSLLKG